ncbi:MAG: hypothetical protein KDN20_01435 [Verrucomicrobiae bacterium]|nr:hypothetical protein [Verrucomicrobiae bacterium]
MIYFSTLLRFSLVLTFAIGAFSAGCASKSGFFRVKNPFPDAASKISQWGDKKSENGKKSGRDSQSDDRLWVAESDESERPQPPSYFGQQGTGERTIKKAAVASTPPRTSPRQSANDQEPGAQPQPSAAAIAAPPQNASGKPCYRCNGKGYRLNSLASDGEFITCETCQGNGRL